MTPEISTRPGILVAIEGIDGAGKTTQVGLLSERLRRSGFSVVQTKEPTDGPWGKIVRNSAATGRLNVEDELASFLKDRQEHVDNLINPSLNDGLIVIVDRYYFSTAAYQGARGLSVDSILAQNEMFAPQPDLLFILDVEPVVGLQRIRARGDSANLFEQEDSLLKCADIFRNMKKSYLRRIDGHLSIEAVHESIYHCFRSGPLFQRLCMKTNKEHCEPEFCSFRIANACRFVRPGATEKSLRVV